MKNIKYLLIILAVTLAFMIGCKEAKPNITVENSKQEYRIGEQFDYSSVKIVLDFSGDKVEIPLTEEMVDDVNLESVGSKEIKINFTYENVEYQTSFNIDVLSHGQIVSASLLNEKVAYLVGQTVDVDSLKIVVYYESNERIEYPVTEEMLNKTVLDAAGSQTITLNTIIENQQIELNTTITVIAIEEVVVNGIQKDYMVGDNLQLNDANLLIKMSDGSETTVMIEKNMVSGDDLSIEGEKLLTINYDVLGIKLETTYLVNVYPASKIVKLEVVSSVGNIFLQHSEFDYDNTTLVVTYENGMEATVQITPDMLSTTKFDEVGEFDVTVTYRGVSTTIVAKVFSEDDYEFELEDYLSMAKALEDIKALAAQIKETMPAEATDDIGFITSSQNKYVVSWLSDNPDVINIVGKVNPQEETVVVHLIAKIYSISFKNVYVECEFDVIVPGLGPVVLKDIEGRKLVFAYTYTGTGALIREEDYKKIDVINICFATVDAYGLTISSQMDSTLREVTKLRRKAGIRIVLSLGGGGSGSEGFSSGCLTAERRTNLVTQLIEAADEYGLDGFDLDWEYPGWSGLTDSHPAVDKTNFTLLCKELRAAMDAYRPGMLLTSAVIGGATTDGVLKYYDLPELNKYMDYLHLMTYDLNDSSVVTHNSNLYSYSRIYSGDNSVKIYAAGGFDKNKLVIGAAFYGKMFTLTTPTTASSAVLNKPASSCKSIQYDVVVSTYMNDSSFHLINDNIAKIHYLTDGKTAIMIETPEDIKTKTQYVFDNNLGGIMFWDYGSDDTGALLNAMYNTIYLNEKE